MSTQANARGTALFDPLKRSPLGAGAITEFGTVLPPSGQVVAYVDSNGVRDRDDSRIKDMIVSTLAAALLRCRANRNDIIIVREGHAENVSDATMLDNLVAGTQIIGVGYGTNKPTFTWTATAGQWTLDQANVRVSGLKFDLTGVDAVVDGIEVSAAHCAIYNCEFDIADSDAAAALIVCSVAAGGDFFRFEGNHVHGDATAGVANCLLIDGTPDNVRITNNLMIASSAVAAGLINVTGVATNIYIADNDIANTETASTACIAVGNVAATGMICRNMVSTLNDGTASAQGVVLGAAALVRAFENYSSDEPKLSGILAPAAAT